MDSYGVLIGADKSQEWLIPWFYTKFRSCNTLPVAICDFGMTEEGKRLCVEKFSMQLLASSFKEATALYDVSFADYDSSYYKQCRRAWFKKAQALALSPFATTLWLDLDCEVLKNLDPLFAYHQQGPCIAMVRDIADGRFSFPLYNGGVILYDRNVEAVKALAKEVIESEEKFSGDDHIFSSLLARTRQEVIELPYCYNWRFCQGALADVFIFHWVAKWGKEWIRQYGGIGSFQKAVFKTDNL